MIKKIILISVVMITTQIFAAKCEDPKYQVRKQLQEMVDQDQMLRFKMLKKIQSNDSSTDHVLELEIKCLTQKHTDTLKSLLHIYGWITISKFDKEADHNAWLLVQHADHDIEFQKEVLKRLEKLYPLKETTTEHFAYLYDRIAKNENRPQRYGTQGNVVEGKWTPAKIEDMKELNARRSLMGLPSFEEYMNQINAAFKC